MMTITRKLLRSILTWLGVLLLLLTLIDIFTSLRTLSDQERQALERFERGMQDSLESRRTVVLALATEVAYNPRVQELFAARDRQQLLELLQVSYVNLHTAFDVSQFQFHLAPATSFLRVNQPTQYGDDLSSFRHTVVAANTNRRPVSGLEIGRTGLGLRGVVPMFYRGYPIGSVEFGLDMGAKWLADIQSRTGGDWQIILRREIAEIARFEDQSVSVMRPTQDLILQDSTLENPFFADEERYQRVLGGMPVLWHQRVAGRSYTVLSTPLTDYSGQIIGIADIVFDRTALIREPLLRLAFNLLLTVATLVIGGWGFAWQMSRIMHPVEIMTKAAIAVASGDFERVVPESSQNELGELAHAFNQMTANLREAFVRAGERAQELDRRARYLEATAAVARDAASELDVEQLLSRVVRLISEKFDFYHAGIFLLDSPGEWAVLRAASSEGGQRMLARGHRLRVGEQGLVGYVAELGQSQIALDVGADRHFFNNPDLPQTRSEMALPLRVHDAVIGVLDVQSVLAEAFSDEDVEVLQTLADQVAMAIHTAHLFGQTQQALEAERRAYGDASREAWLAFLRSQSVLGFVKEGALLRPIEDVWAPEMRRAVQLEQTVIEKTEEGITPSLTVPIRVRDQTIAVLSADLPEGTSQWAPDQIALLEAISGQLAQALERARLYEETQLNAARERTIAETTGRLREPVELTGVLQVAAAEMRRVLNLEELVVRLATPEM
ncbi:MAG TPA: cache domain-containing protein, partial [Anaerolineae bacterium]|nr:cache domain-containing protein [Anaerolineae bacterium]